MSSEELGRNQCPDQPCATGSKEIGTSSRLCGTRQGRLRKGDLALRDSPDHFHPHGDAVYLIGYGEGIVPFIGQVELHTVPTIDER